MKTRIAVLVSGGGTNLQALLDAEAAGRIPHGEIVLVVSNKPGAYALERAKKAGVPAAVVSKQECGSQAAFEQRLQGILELDGVDMIILAGFMSILSQTFTAKWPNRILNVHPSLIPAFCGAGYYGLRVHEAALARGVKVTGATVHMVNEIPDGGPIVLQKAVEVLPGDTPETLQRRVMEQAEWILLPQAAELVAQQLAAR
ncbi:MAG: phosphoribosylglycinamide formyltransferase [Oscillospiraceae bacterium]|nr:phosphoribosylglycinamide formyltransferase [Bacillota bacterium]